MDPMGEGEFDSAPRQEAEQVQINLASAGA